MLQEKWQVSTDPGTFVCRVLREQSCSLAHYLQS